MNRVYIENNKLLYKTTFDTYSLHLFCLSVMVLDVFCLLPFLDLSLLFPVFSSFFAFNSLGKMGFLKSREPKDVMMFLACLSPVSAFSLRMDMEFGSRTSKTKGCKYFFNQKNMNILSKLFLNNDMCSKNKIMVTKEIELFGILEHILPIHWQITFPCY